MNDSGGAPWWLTKVPLTLAEYHHWRGSAEDAEDRIQQIAVALDRTIKTAIELGRAQERETRRLSESTELDTPRGLQEAAEFDQWQERLGQLLRASLRGGAS